MGQLVSVCGPVSNAWPHSVACEQLVRCVYARQVRGLAASSSASLLEDKHWCMRSRSSYKQASYKQVTGLVTSSNAALL